MDVVLCAQGIPRRLTLPVSPQFCSWTTPPRAPPRPHNMPISDPPPLSPVYDDLHLDEPPPPEPPLASSEFPPGSIIHHLIQDQVQPPSPPSAFNFLLSLQSDAIEQSSLAKQPTPPSITDSVVWVVGCTRVFGLHLDSQLTLQSSHSNTPSLLIDGGAKYMHHWQPEHPGWSC